MCHTHTRRTARLKMCGVFLWWREKERNDSLEQKINTNTFPGHTGTARARCNLLSIMLTWKHNLPVTVDDVVKHSAFLLLRISQLLQKHYETHLLCVRYVWGCFQLYLVFTAFSHSSCVRSLMNFRDICCFDTRLMRHDVTTKLYTGGTERPAGQFNSGSAGIYRSYFC